MEEGSIPVLPETQEICQALGLDPLGLLASGALLLTLPAANVPALLRAWKLEGIEGWEIGQMLAPEEGLLKIGYDGETALARILPGRIGPVFLGAGPVPRLKNYLNGQPGPRLKLRRFAPASRSPRIQ